MRFLVETNRKDGGWVVSIAEANTSAPASADRVLSRCAKPHDRFPLPPVHAATHCEGGTHALCQDLSGEGIADAFDRVNRVDVAGADIQKFGRYLTMVLLGENLVVLKKAAGPAQEIELEILIESQDQDLTSLPWEMMYGTNGPLGAQRGPTVAITRVVRSTNPIGPIPELERPLHVLFVVGRQIDHVLRPGAELIGILRRLRVPVDPAFTAFQSTDLRVQYLSEATWDEIQNAVSEFKPAVVHLVCHGEVDPGGAGAQLLLTARKVDGDPQSDKVAEPYRCSAARLLDLLAPSGVLPPVVVVNACHTADTGGGGSTQAAESGSNLAFGAELVRGGVAMALGMSGEVAERACQMFTLRFYQALLQECSVSLAAAHGRRAALLGFPDQLETVEWARPTLFLAKGVEPLLKLKTAAQNFSAIGGRFRKLKFPEALCDRYEFLQNYEDIRHYIPAQAGRTPVMAVTVKEAAGGVGKTRLLEEIAARLVFDNFVPILVRNDEQNREPPQNFLELALQISAAIDEARSHFQVTSQPLTNAKRLAFKLAGITPDPGDIVAFSSQQLEVKAYLHANRTSGPPADVKMPLVAPIIQEDCAELRNDVQAKTGEHHHIVILLDDLHRYAGVAPDLIEQAREFGLGTTDLPLPVVFTYIAAEIQGKGLEDLLRKRPDIRSVPLTAFESEVEQRLAFTQFVLSFWKYAVNSRQKREFVDSFFGDMRDYTGGRPVQFSLDTVGAVVKIHYAYGTLVDANFEELFSKWH